MRPPRAARQTGASKWLWWLATNTAGPLSWARLRLPMTVKGDTKLRIGTSAPYWTALRTNRAGGDAAPARIQPDRVPLGAVTPERTDGQSGERRPPPRRPAAAARGRRRA